jgi:hypothetical protein
MTQLDVFPRNSITLKLPTWKPQPVPAGESECEAIRKLAVEAVYKIWNTEHRPADLMDIYVIVTEKIGKLRADDEWPWKEFRSKRTVDRRVNEASSKDFYADGIPKICAVTSGVYQPNPRLFAKKPLEALT